MSYCDNQASYGYDLAAHHKRLYEWYKAISDGHKDKYDHYEALKNHHKPCMATSAEPSLPDK